MSDEKENYDMDNTMIPVNISLEDVHPFAGHPYQVRDDEEMDALIESAKRKAF